MGEALRENSARKRSEQAPQAEQLGAAKEGERERTRLGRHLPASKPNINLVPDLSLALSALANPGWKFTHNPRPSRPFIGISVSAVN